MATKTAKGKGRGRAGGTTDEAALPRMVNQFDISRATGINTETIRKWVSMDPPKFPVPSSVVGIFLLWEESRVREYLGVAKGKGG